MSKKYDILVIDDEQIVIDAVVKIFSAEGFEVDTAVDAQTGLVKLSKNSYKIIISDIMMPELNGFGLMEELRKREIKIPVIMTTGYSTVENAVKSLYVGAVDFIAKPFTADEIINSVYRGLKYIEIQKQIEESNRKGRTTNDSTLYYVPCPAKYFRLGYTSWAEEESIGSIRIGVTDLFLKTIDNISKIELQNLDDEVTQGNPCGQIVDNSGRSHLVLSPVTGKIIERNEDITNNTSLLEKDPYFKGWFYRLIPNDSEFELKQLIPCSSDRL
jgi:FixJ family two-component response regulator/glycine cleavage system H lipoate-binding protein